MAKKRRTKKSQSSLRLYSRKIQHLIGGGSLVVMLVLLPRPVPANSVDQVPEVNQSNKLFSLDEPADIPYQTNTTPVPSHTAQGVYIFDPDSNISLYSYQADRQLLPASTTKMMTALVALDTFPMDKTITIKEEERTIGNTMDLTRGEILTVKDLLAGVLISSGNDAALALALAYPETGYSGFVAQMNKKAKALGLKNTRFRNVSGVESPNHYSSAKDLAILARYGLKNPLFQDMVSTEAIEIISQGTMVNHQLQTTNKLLGKVPGLAGVKTGWTENAGECLVSYVERDGREIIVVVLDSQDRFGESEALIEWVYENFKWHNPLEVESMSQSSD